MQNHHLIIKEADFSAPFWAKNHHVQSLLGTLKFRRPSLIKKSKALLESCQEVILDAGVVDGEAVRLQSYYSPINNNDTPLVIILHGWEGSHQSLYMLSAANYLYSQGFQILRLNFRDHGTSHHLNEEIFHSNRLQEVINAIKTASETFNYSKLFLVGFSLGGNFSCRVAADATKNHLDLTKVIAICPAINPKNILSQLENGLFFYHDYFIKKWKRSLKRKEALFPNKYNFDAVYNEKSMRKMTVDLVELFGQYESIEHYFKGYSLAGNRLASIKNPTTILMAQDDPIIAYQDIHTITQNQHLDIYRSSHGGHCGFIKNITLESWCDEFILKQMTPYL